MQPAGLIICLTGPAYALDGQPILREDLVHACKAMGMIVQPHFTADTQLLVASRADTVKAAKAATRGVPVMTYFTFLEHFQIHVRPAKAAIPNRYVDTHKHAPSNGLYGGPEL